MLTLLPSKGQRDTTLALGLQPRQKGSQGRGPRRM